ncbi:MAG: hypothetical protein LUQ65_09515 [Candidatus Helarchaeota archaeon]|nr:hypothetical protein [Candidatus Helarchaeota archaeon]
MKLIQQLSRIERFDVELSIGRSGTPFAKCSLRRKLARQLKVFYKPLTPGIAYKHVEI